MPTTYFLNMNGRTFGQVAPGASSMYGLDHLGSVVQTLDNNGLAQNQYRYHPYGTTEASSETAAPSFYRWLGSLGYRPTGRSYSEFYVGHRHYGSRQAAWTSRDRRWPRQRAYLYCLSKPTLFMDRTGKEPETLSTIIARLGRGQILPPISFPKPPSSPVLSFPLPPPLGERWDCNFIGPPRPLPPAPPPAANSPAQPSGPITLTPEPSPPTTDPCDLYINLPGCHDFCLEVQRPGNDRFNILGACYKCCDDLIKPALHDPTTNCMVGCDKRLSSNVPVDEIGIELAKSVIEHILDGTE